ncbi:AraC family transcriptional regulator [Hyphomicrobium sp.]|uniref:AraC family transcriptional regulator n=1 Tax=Hyphomicrobium sp. TaxID=82 RepID=UPI002FDF80DC
MKSARPQTSAAPGKAHVSLTIESSDRDELSEYFSRRVSKVEISPASDHDAIRLSSSVVPIANAIALKTSMPHGGNFLQKEDLDGIFALLPLSGRAVMRAGPREVSCSQIQGFLGPMNEGDVLACSEQFAVAVLKLSQDELIGTLSQLLDRPVVRPITFSPELNGASPAARTLLSLVLAAAQPADAASCLAPSSRAAAHFSETLTMFVLENFQHSYSALLSHAAHDIRPSYILRATEFMREKADHPLTLPDISAAAGISIRALHYGFKQFLGMSPMEYLRQIRLEGAYRDLLSASESTSIAQIAKKWGFVTPRGFAIHCKRSYGRTPSEIRQQGWVRRR